MRRDRCALSWSRYSARSRRSEGNAEPAAGRGRKKATKAVAKRKRTMTEEQRTAVSERMRKYWSSRREAKAQEEAVQE